MLNVNITKKLADLTISAEISPDVGITVLFGASGAGKSSIINMLAGLMTPTEGKIILDGRVLFDSAQKIDLPPEKRDIGYVFQDGRLFPHLTVLKNLQYGMKDKRANIDDIVDLLGIAKLLNRSTTKLSGGEKQRVAIGRALLTSPKMLLMYEPMASLDSLRKEELIGYIAKIPAIFNIPVIYVSHSIDEVVRLANYIGIVVDGKITRFGAAQEVFDSSEYKKIIPPQALDLFPKTR
jgi:molybdate transport system ATP-binding protein